VCGEGGEGGCAVCVCVCVRVCVRECVCCSSVRYFNLRAVQVFQQHAQ